MDGTASSSAGLDDGHMREFEGDWAPVHGANQDRSSRHGPEAVAVGASALAPRDVVAPTYRGHAWALARGIGVNEAFAEVMGKQSGCNRGRGGSKHLGDLSKGVLPGNAIVGATLPLAAGIGYASLLDGADTVALASFGDGAANQGSVHEAMNLAALFKLPVIMVCENNLYSEMTPLEHSATVERISERAAGYRIPAIEVDGMDLEAMSAAVGEAADRARSGGGATFIEAMTYRFCGHMPGDMQTYRTDEEVAEWRKRDPLIVTQRRLEGLVSAKGRLVAQAKTDVQRQRPLPLPLRTEGWDIGLVAGWQVESGRPPRRVTGSHAMTSTTATRQLSFSRAIAECLYQEMERDEDVVVMGEDIGHHGGIFAATKGLQEHFGDRRVLDTPISETGFVGMAIGPLSPASVQWRS